MRTIKTVLFVIILSATLTTTTGCFDTTNTYVVQDTTRNDLGIKNPVTVFLVKPASYSGALNVFCNNVLWVSTASYFPDSITVPDSSDLIARWGYTGSYIYDDTIATDHMTWHIGN